MTGVQTCALPISELARGGWLTGFPWGAGGYAHLDGPFIPLARWAGVYGLGLVPRLPLRWPP